MVGNKYIYSLTTLKTCKHKTAFNKCLWQCLNECCTYEIHYLLAIFLKNDISCSLLKSFRQKYNRSG